MHISLNTVAEAIGGRGILFRVFHSDLKHQMSKLRRPLIGLAKDFIVGTAVVGILLLIWRIAMEVGRQFILLSPIDQEWIATSWLKTALFAIFLLVLILITGRGCQVVFGKRLATTPGFRRLARSGELLITELSPDERQGYKVVLVKLTTQENRQLAILTSILEDEETGCKLATVFVPNTPDVRVGQTRVLPFDNLTITNWTVSDAMTFLMTGGGVSPPKIHFSESAAELDD